MPQRISLKVSMVVDAGLYINLCTGCIVSFALLSRFNSMQTKVFLLSPSNTEIFLIYMRFMIYYDIYEIYELFFVATLKNII